MKANDIKKVACVGAGVIGASFATNFAMKGLPTVVCNIRAPRLEEAKAFIENNLSYLLEKGVINKADFELAMSNVEYTTDFEKGLRDVQFIQENGPENYKIKKTLLAEIEAHTSSETIIASSTSGLLISEIAKMARHPERCVGGHPYNPPHLIPLVEITKSEQTSNEAVQCAYDFYKMIGKEPIVLQKETLGFLANRLQIALYREIVHLVMNGVCTVEDADKALVFGPGLRWAIMGMCMCLELSGGKVGIEGLTHHLEPSWNLWLKDMANWDEFPYKDWPEIVQKGVLEELANRPAEFGNTHESITRFRDDFLIDILEGHKKL